MPTYSQLESETWWRREIVPTQLAMLAVALREHFGRGPSDIGSKGDNNHLYGYHRSREWILNSSWSQNGASDYSIRQAPDKGGDARWVTAIDIGPGSLTELIGMCARLDVAVRADRFPQIREWYGNANGDKIVDGWDNWYDRAASSDSSHLSHLHISFFRSRADEDHSGLLAVLTGDTPTGDDLMLMQVKGNATIYITRGAGYTPINYAAFIAVTAVGQKVAVFESLADMENVAGKPVVESAPVPGVDLDTLAAKVAALLRPVMREELDKTRLTA